MNNYYFTFGQSHNQLDGTEMKDYFVRVVAKDYFFARTLFIIKFTIPKMGRETAWSFQYEEKDWKPEYFPKGEYEVITQE